MYELTIMCSSLFLKHVYKGKPSGALGDAPGRKAEKLCTSALCLDGLLPACEFISFQWERGEGLQNLRVSWNPHWALSVEAQHRDLVLRGDLPWPNVCSSPFLGKWVEGQTRVPAFIKWHPTAPALLSSHEGLKALALGPRSCRPPPLCQGCDSLIVMQLVISLETSGHTCVQRALAMRAALRHRRHHTLLRQSGPHCALLGVGYAALCICIWIPTFVLLIQINAHVVGNIWAKSRYLSCFKCPNRRLGKGLGFQVYMGGGGAFPSHRRGCNINCPSRRLTLLLTQLRGRFCKC